MVINTIETSKFNPILMYTNKKLNPTTNPNGDNKIPANPSVQTDKITIPSNINAPNKAKV